eukprot:2367074-Prymnesium_polylepis.1
MSSWYEQLAGGYNAAGMSSMSSWYKQLAGAALCCSKWLQCSRQAATHATVLLVSAAASGDNAAAAMRACAGISSWQLDASLQRLG